MEVKGGVKEQRLQELLACATKEPTLPPLLQGQFNKVWMLFDKVFWQSNATWITRIPVRLSMLPCIHSQSSP